MAQPAADSGSLVQLRGVSKHVGMVQVLNDIDLDLARGEVVAVLGPSGSGKSTLCRAINGTERIDSGRITVDGQPLPWRRRERARIRAGISVGIGVVSRPFQFTSYRTVLENVAAGRFRWWEAATPPGARRKARALLERVGAAEHAARFPWELSEEEQQLVATARALAGDPKLMLFDQPGPGLPPELPRSLAADGLGLLLATDEPGLARSAADRVVFMDGGRIIEQSPPDEFFTVPRTARARDFLARTPKP
jgi:glutamate transport system ATP-binding protein